mgnify:CR=1 FL=1
MSSKIKKRNTWKNDGKNIFRQNAEVHDTKDLRTISLSFN